MADWIGVIGVVLGMILGAGIQEFRFWMERKQRYRIMTFDKRLEAHQMAFYWCQRLNEVLNVGQPDKIYETATEAREWWNSNCLFLDNNSRKNVLGVFNLAHTFAMEREYPERYEVKMGSQIWSRLDDSKKAIMEGIGTEYLPELKSESK